MDAPIRDIRLAETIEAQAMRDLFAAAPAVLGLATPTIDGATVLIAPGLADPFFNRVIGLGESQPAREATLDAIAGAYRDAGVGKYWIHVTTAAEPPALGDWLAARGYTPPNRARWAKFLRDSARPPAPVTALTIERATPAVGDDFAHVACVAYGMPDALGPWFAGLVGRPGWHCVIAREGAQAVSVGALYVEDGLGWLGVAGTLPDWRRHGAQTALLAERIRIAAEVGCRALSTETGEPIGDEPNPSLANIARAGFVKVGSRRNFASP